MDDDATRRLRVERRGSAVEKCRSDERAHGHPGCPVQLATTALVRSTAIRLHEDFSGQALGCECDVCRFSQLSVTYRSSLATSLSSTYLPISRRNCSMAL